MNQHLNGGSRISKIKATYWRNTHKFGIEVPKSVDEVYAFDCRTDTTFWTDSINKEMKNVIIAFKSMEGTTEEDMREGKV